MNPIYACTPPEYVKGTFVMLAVLWGIKQHLLLFAFQLLSQYYITTCSPFVSALQHFTVHDRFTTFHSSRPHTPVQARHISRLPLVWHIDLRRGVHVP